MSVDCAAIQKRMLEALDVAADLGLDQTSVACTVENGFSVTARQGDVESIEHHRQIGFAVHVYHQERQGSFYTTSLTPQSVIEAVHKAKSLAEPLEPDSATGLPDKDQLAFSPLDLSLCHPWKITPREAIDLAIDLEARACAWDSRVVLSEGASVSTHLGEQYFANSLGMQANFTTSEHGKSVGLVAVEGDSRESDYEYTQARLSSQLWDNERLAQSAGKKVISRLGARSLKTRRCPVVFSPSVAKGLLRHFFSAVSGRALYRRSSFLLDACGQAIFPPFVHLYQRPHLPTRMGSAPFDAEGVYTRDYDLVRDGVLQQYILGTYSARKLGLKTTGNSGGIYTMFMKPTLPDQNAVLKEMGTGLLVTDLMGQGVNITTGNYSRGAFGYWVENGQIQYPVHEITIASNLKEMFLGLIAVGGDLDERGCLQTGSLLIREMMIAGS
jgi:PmbA protein